MSKLIGMTLDSNEMMLRHISGFSFHLLSLNNDFT
jgi:hypothetical protein